jgi:hypothetical protein
MTLCVVHMHKYFESVILCLSHFRTCKKDRNKQRYRALKVRQLSELLLY